MKKTFTLIAGAIVALSASAQVEAVFSTGEGLEALGLSGDVTELAGGSVLATGEAGTVFAAFTDNAKTTSIKADGVQSVIVNHEEFAITTGTTGSSNPAGVGIETAPTGGWVYKYTCEKDGYATIFGKLSSNKPYYVFESEAGNDAYMLLSYSLHMMFQGEVNSYTLPGSAEDGYFYMDLPDADKYSDGTSLRWPEKIFLGADAEDVKKNGFGCITFPVLAGYDYLFCAQGSKLNNNGVVWTAEEPNQIIGYAPEKVNEETGETTPAVVIEFVGKYDGTGINDIISDAVLNENAPIYNVLGQPVSKDYKGIQIQNGKKFYNR